MTSNQKGQILIIVIAALGVVLFSVLFIITGAQIYFGNSEYTYEAEKATALAEAGVDKALASLNKTGGSYNGETEVSLGAGTYSVKITSADAATKIIEATGYIPNKDTAKVKRTIKIMSSRGLGVSFNYGVQVGEGGLEMKQNSKVDGSVYSNGSIRMDNNSKITGDGWVAGGVSGTPDQQNECVGVNCSDFIFGKSVSGQTRLDVAESFQLSADSKVSKVALKLKKFGTPPDVTVRILKDKNGQPDKGEVKTTGTLYAGLVTGSYGFVEVTFSSSPNLESDKIYWLMVDTQEDSSNYWSWSADLAQSYTRGAPKWSPNWNSGNPTWNSIPADLDFSIFVGGVATSIIGSPGVSIGGDAHANTLRNLTVTGGAYYQVIDDVTAGSLHPGSEDPAPKVMPISDANISQWKQEAETAGIFTGNITDCPSGTMPAGKYVGNLIISHDKRCTITVQSPIWITGTLNLDNNNIIKLDPSYDSSSGVIVVDGVIELDNKNKALGSGTPGSVLVLLSTYDSTINDNIAIHLKNDGNSGVIYTGNGKIEVGNGNQIKEATGWKIKLKENTIVTYEQGMAGLFFTGPGGSYSLIKGTYQVK